jgi:hypothetical protein
MTDNNNILIPMHEYISDSYFIYSECTECKKRTPHVCIRCHYCYSCHPKIEKLEKEKKKEDVRITKYDDYYHQVAKQSSPFVVYKRRNRR